MSREDHDGAGQLCDPLGAAGLGMPSLTVTTILFTTLTVLILAAAIWREIRLIRASVVQREYLNVTSQVLIFASIDFLTIVFISFLIGSAVPTLAAISGPMYVKISLCGLLLGLTLAGAGHAVTDAALHLKSHSYPRFISYMALAIMLVAVAITVYVKYLRS